MSLAVITSLTRLNLGDQATAFQAQVAGNGVDVRFELPYELIEPDPAQLTVSIKTGVVVTVLTQDQVPPLAANTYMIDARNGTVTLWAPLATGATLVVDGSYYAKYLPEDLSQFIDAAFLQHTKGRASERQTVTITGAPTGGTFTLTYGVAQTVALAYNATTAAIQAALELIPTIGVGNVLVAGGPLPGTAVTVDFVGALAGRWPSLKATSALTGGASPAITAVAAPFNYDDLPAVERYPLSILITIEALWGELAEASNEVDVVTPEGMHIPAGQRFQQILQAIETLMGQYREIAGALGVGLFRVEMFTLRRTSRTTGRLVPVYRPQEFDDHSLPERLYPPIDRGF